MLSRRINLLAERSLAATNAMYAAKESGNRNDGLAPSVNADSAKSGSARVGKKDPS